MDPKKLRRFRKLSRAMGKSQDPEVKQAYASKLTEMAKAFTPELKTKYGERYGIEL